MHKNIRCDIALIELGKPLNDDVNSLRDYAIYESYMYPYKKLFSFSEVIKKFLTSNKEYILGTPVFTPDYTNEKKEWILFTEISV